MATISDILARINDRATRVWVEWLLTRGITEEMLDPDLADRIDILEGTEDNQDSRPDSVPRIRRKSGVGLELLIRASNSTSGKICIVDADDPDEQQIASIDLDPYTDPFPGTTIKSNLGGLTLDTGEGEDLVLKRDGTEIARLTRLASQGGHYGSWHYASNHYGSLHYSSSEPALAVDGMVSWTANGDSYGTLDHSNTNHRRYTFPDADITVENTGHTAKHKHGGSDEVSTATAGANLIPKADGTGKLDIGWIPVGSVDHGLLTGLGDDDHPQYTTDAEATTIAEASVNTHVGLADPHTQYQKESEKGAASGYASLSAGVKVVEDPANAQNAAAAGKIPLADGAGKIPNGWITQGTGSGLDADLLDGLSSAAFEAAGAAESAINTHVGLADPHTQYQKESEKSAANGYASLDAGTKVPTAELGGAGASSAKWLRGDQSWQDPIFGDNVFRVAGSVDSTKRLAFEVDGLTAEATRTVTIPDTSGTLHTFTSGYLSGLPASMAVGQVYFSTDHLRWHIGIG